MSSQEEIIPIVNLDDEIIGYKARKDITAEDIYRVSGCRVKDEEGNILLTQRAWTKKHDPGKRGPAVAGTVQQGESYLENIIKEIHEEVNLKISQDDIQVGPKKFSDRHWKYFAQYYILIYIGDKTLLKAEKGAVEQLKRFTPIELKQALRDHPDDFLHGVHWGFECFNLL